MATEETERPVPGNLQLSKGNPDDDYELRFAWQGVCIGYCQPDTLQLHSLCDQWLKDGITASTNCLSMPKLKCRVHLSVILNASNLIRKSMFYCLHNC